VADVTKQKKRFSKCGRHEMSAKRNLSAVSAESASGTSAPTLARIHGLNAGNGNDIAKMANLSRILSRSMCAVEHLPGGQRSSFRTAAVIDT
jgi:hypothetical protein